MTRCPRDSEILKTVVLITSSANLVVILQNIHEHLQLESNIHKTLNTK